MRQDSEFADPLQALAHDLQDDLKIVDELVHQRAASDHVQRIGQVAGHLFTAGGKRVRPILTLASARLFNCEGINHIRLATALEFIHTTTLLHDDVIDRSSRRRGRPTANLLWDDKSSILVGDFLFARAFQLMVATSSVDALTVLADSSAAIAEAEVLQLARQHDTGISEEDYFRIINGKTAALFATGARVGALIAGAGAADCRAAEKFGKSLGISYQIRDDLLDYIGTDKSLGKNVGDDFRDRKVTLPLLRAVQSADVEERAFWNRVIDRGQQREGDLETALSILQSRNILEQVQAEAEAWSNSAIDELRHLPDHPIRGRLRRLAEFAAHRGV
ncbi:MAG: polyprenyl synthetase family protein [Rhodobacteraceae bacterium]|nr:polyprenyl synthetase family protein [Paracoccaceae bacterium]